VAPHSKIRDWKPDGRLYNLLRDKRPERERGPVAGFKKTQLNDLFIASSLDKDEITVVWQTINVENNCHYCVPAHTLIAKSMKVDDAIIDALRNETPLPNARLEALRDFTLSIVRDRGQVEDAKVQAFLDAGFTKRNILEVILGYSQKIMSNYTNHLADTPLDSVFEKFAWEKA
jgi:alkylhydroperoxidase family enzyme